MKKIGTMKRLVSSFSFFLSLSALLAVPSQGQVIEESFETWPPEGWTLLTESGVGEWEQSALEEANAPAAAADGEYAAMANWNNLVQTGLTASMTSPVFDLSDLENPEFSFSWYHEFSDKEHSRMEVLVAYDSGDFELLETISTNTTTSDWVRWRRILDQDVKQVRIRTIKENWYGQKPIFIDHILLQEGPSCTYPDDLEARLLPGEDGTALLQWTASEQANAWRIKVSSQSIDPATEEADVLTAEVQDSTRYQVSGLQVGESYFWYVQTLCGESGSDWIAGDTLEVYPAPLQVPFLLDFEESDEGFQRIQENQVNAWYWGSQAYGGDTNRCFFVSDDGGESYHLSSSQGSRSHLWRDIVFPADAPQGFELSFDFKGNGSTYNQVMEVSIVEDLDYLPSAGNFIDHFNVSYTLDEYLHFSPEWSHRSYEIPASFAGKDVRLVITWRNSDMETAANPPAAFDNFGIDRLKCPSPKNLHITETGTQTLSVAWDTLSEAAHSWILEYGDYGFESGNGTRMEVDQMPFTLSGLTECSRYDIILTARCGSEEAPVLSQASDPLHAVTDCEPKQAPYSTDFDDLVDTQYPLGWSYVSNHSYMAGMIPYFIAHDFYAHSKPNCMLLNSALGNTNMGLVSPEFSDLGERNKRIRFWSRMSGPFILEVGVMKDTSQPESFLKIAELSGWDYVEYDQSGTAGAGMFQHSVPLTDERITDEYKYIVLRSGTGTMQEVGSVDDFLYEEIPACIEPVNLRPVDIDVSSARIIWDAQGEESRWEVAYGLDSFEPSEETEDIETEQNSIMLENLESFRFYRVFVRAVCSETEKGPWSQALVFRTCGYGDLPFSEGFEESSTYNVPLCWQVRDEASLWQIDDAQPLSGQYHLAYPANEPRVDDYLFTPVLYLHSRSTYNIRFWVKKGQDREARLSLWYRTLSDTSAQHILDLEENLSDQFYTEVQATFQPERSDYYHIGFRYESTVSSGLLIDDVEISESTGIEDGKSVSGSKVYPNPASDQFFIDLGNENQAKVSIFSAQGQLVREIPAYQSLDEIQTSSLPAGTYMIVITKADKVETHKINIL